MTACLMAERWLRPGARPVEILLVESPDIGIVGVGEGSTPQLKALFDRLGIAEAEWMPRADATYKLGIGFERWSSDPAHQRYFHAFPGPVDLHTQPAFVARARMRRQGYAVAAQPDDWYLAAHLAERRLGPHPAASFPFAPSYGYHFDAYRVGEVLRDAAVRRSVIHRQARVERVELAENGDVRALVVEGGEAIAGDFFIDCSGFRSVIAQQALGARFVSFADNLFNDAAVVMPTPSEPTTAIATRATALSAGWAWAIPLTTRIGNGYVYASAHVGADAAEAELRAHLGVGDDVPARHLKMKVGRVADSWTRNCLAAGLAQGFLEPLEATALHIVQATADEFVAAFDAGGFTPQHRDRFNARIARRYEGVRDYIVAHYRMNLRTDTDYWRANAANEHLSDDLKAMMTAWFTGADLEAAIAERDIGGYYASISWHALFAGYGVFPPADRLKPLPPGHAAPEIGDLLARSAINFASHDEQLAQLRER
ncbi:tryptophan 7-halogenase [Sphingomonas baiyangensis]|uniref:Tryptophan 7-halogenase n=2 Tax=Sphingomonas baiyangensis TaxID=2572576 RepID=A0A4U1L7I1_9SPHN|nr:tryptophan 7-halogenase [Sphingomonas baiyangensis]